MKGCRKIWLIDDDVIYQSLVNFLFENDLGNYSLETFENGELGYNELLNRAKNELDIPSVILLDLNMPIMDGWKFLDKYEKWDWKNKSDINLFVISSSVSIIDKNRALSFTVVKDYISKPISHDELKKIDIAYARS